VAPYNDTSTRVPVVRVLVAAYCTKMSSNISEIQMRRPKRFKFVLFSINPHHRLLNINLFLWKGYIIFCREIWVFYNKVEAFRLRTFRQRFLARLMSLVMCGPVSIKYRVVVSLLNLPVPFWRPGSKFLGFLLSTFHASTSGSGS
jgi:hypothetical protein